MADKHSFWATLTATIEINDSDFELIQESCKHHYDFKIKSLVEVGGFLYGAKNRRDWSPEDKEIEFTFRQIDSVMKSLEMYTTEQSYALYSRLRSIIMEINEKTIALNDTLKEKTK